jgi:hypothetical protein
LLPLSLLLLSNVSLFSLVFEISPLVGTEVSDPEVGASESLAFGSGELALQEISR